jgi:metallo-beta-lactamase family protein
MLGQSGHILDLALFALNGISSLFNCIFRRSGRIAHRRCCRTSDPEPCNLLVMESTYGDRCHEQRQERVKRLGAALTRALMIMVKCSSQPFHLPHSEILYEIDRLFSDPEWQQPFPVFIDSPLGEQLTTVYSRLSAFWDAEAKALLHSGDHPLDFERLQIVKSYQEHQELLRMPGPAIIIAGSGMCSGGRIVAHLVHGLEDPRNDVFFIGYQPRGLRDATFCLIVKNRTVMSGWTGKRFIRANIHKLSVIQPTPINRTY